MTLKTTHATGEAIEAADMNSQSEAIVRNQHNILELLMENFFVNKITALLGLFFDAFFGETKTDILTNASIDASTKRLNLGIINPASMDFELSSTQFLSITDADQTGLDRDDTDKITVEMYINPEQLPSVAVAEMGLIAKNQDAPKSAYVLQFLSNDILVFTVTKDGTGANAASINTDAAFLVGGDIGNWVHVAATYDASTQIGKIYKNGVQVATTDLGSGSRDAIFNTDADFRIGAKGGAGTSVEKPFDGKIDDVRVHDFVKTVTQIFDDKDKQLTGAEAGLKGYWRLNNNLLDSTANGNTLTNNNSTPFVTDVPFGGGAAPTSGTYESITTSFQQSMATARLWVVRNFTFASDQFNLDAGISAGATTLTIAGDKTGVYANGDTIDISTSDNLTRERKTLTAVPTFSGGVTTLTFSATANAFGTSAFVERVNVIPQISLVNIGDAKSFQSLTFVRSEVGTGSAGNGIETDEVEDEYQFTASTAQEDLKIKLTLDRNDTSIAVFAKRLGTAVNP